MFESKDYFTLLLKPTVVGAVIQKIELIENAEDKRSISLKCDTRFVIRIHKCSLNMKYQ